VANLGRGGREAGVTLAETILTPTETHFTEGEPDLEPPEELAIAELDEQTMLEEELDNEELREEEVDEDTLEAALDDLVHATDEGDDADDALVDDDREEPLDALFVERFALLDDGAPDEDTVEMSGAIAPPGDRFELDDVTPRRTGEFVCRSCFLVRTRVQLADATTMACRDCVT
jgi:hypothetical protein